MSSAKDEVLQKIRAANGATAVARSVDLTAIKRDYQRHALRSTEDRLELFIDRLNDYGSTVHRCRQSEIPSVVYEILKAKGRSRVLVAPGIPADWLPSQCNFVVDDHLGYREIDTTDGVLTGCALAIALTGTIVLAHSAATGRRAITLIPDYHLCVVFEEQVLETVPEAIVQLQSFGTAPLTTISGPSATSDIEMTRVKGVHGPRTLEIILAHS